MIHPIDLQLLPDAARRALGGPPPLKMMVARAMAPLPPVALVCALYGLAHDPSDEKLRETAEKTLLALPEAVLNGALGAPDLPSAVLDDLAVRLAANRAVIERIVRHPATLGETVERIARKCDEAMTELIATNEQRLIAHPAIIEVLYLNEHTRMSTADRVVELAARHNLSVKVPGFEQIVAALKQQKPPAPETAEAKTSDAQFREAMAVAKETEAAGADVVKEEEDGSLKFNEAGEKADKNIAKMNVTEKIRTAMLGNAAQRAVLIRSPNKLVSSAVLESPKLNEDEIVKYSASRQVGEEVLRRIAGRKDFTRIYDVKLNLVNNPKTPLSESMKFLAHLRDGDVRKLLGNKNVPAGLRNAATGLIQSKGKK